VHQRMIGRIKNDVEKRNVKPITFAADALMDVERKETGKLLGAAERAARKLRKAEAFWR